MSTINQVNAKVDVVKTIMHQNIETHLGNIAKAGIIKDAAENLLKESGIFKNNIKKPVNKLWWKSVQYKLLFVGIIAIVYSTKNKD
jgi:hypothetical protein